MKYDSKQQAWYDTLKYFDIQVIEESIKVTSTQMLDFQEDIHFELLEFILFDQSLISSEVMNNIII